METEMSRGWGLKTWWLEDAVRCVSGEVSAGNGDGGDGGGFGAEDAGAEGYGLPCVLEEEGDLFGGPAAFGAYGDGVGDGRSLSYGFITRRSN
jgi:hypothetical protein